MNANRLAIGTSHDDKGTNEPSITPIRPTDAPLSSRNAPIERSFVCDRCEIRAILGSNYAISDQSDANSAQNGLSSGAPLRHPSLDHGHRQAPVDAGQGPFRGATNAEHEPARVRPLSRASHRTASRWDARLVLPVRAQPPNARRAPRPTTGCSPPKLRRTSARPWRALDSRCPPRNRPRGRL